MTEHDDLDPTTREVVERLAAADAAADSTQHYGGVVPTARRPWYRRLLDSRTVIVVLIAIAASFLAYSILVNQQAIKRTNDQATAAKAQAKAAASGQLAAVQLICTLERDIRQHSVTLTVKEKADLQQYDTELECKDALSQPHAHIKLSPEPHPSPAHGGASGPAPPVQPQPTSNSGGGSRSNSPAPSHRPPPPPHSTHSPTPRPTPTSCTLRDPVTGKCILHVTPLPVLTRAAALLHMLIVTGHA